MTLRPVKFTAFLLVGVMIIMTLSLPSFAQGRGRGRGLSKKSTRFVNGHDARDGRFDKALRPRRVRARWRSRQLRRRPVWVRTRPRRLNRVVIR